MSKYYHNNNKQKYWNSFVMPSKDLSLNHDIINEIEDNCTYEILDICNDGKVQRKKKISVKNRELYTVYNLFYPIVDLNGNVIEHLHVMHDLTEIVKLNEEIVDTQKEVVFTMGAIGETRSKEMGFHVKRVAEYSYLIAKLMGMSEEESSLLKQASHMHDIGKVGIPDNILNKPSKLTPEEFEVMKTHAQIGYEMLKYSNRDILKASSIVALTHHEKWDGTGYPRQLKGDDIPLEARMMALADVYDALISKRVYKEAISFEESEQIIINGSGTHFDPILVGAFIEIKDKFKEIATRIS